MLYQFCSRFGLVSLPEVFQGVQPLCLDALGQLSKLCPIAAHGVLVPDCGPQHSQQEQHQQPTASVVLSVSVASVASSVPVSVSVLVSSLVLVLVSTTVSAVPAAFTETLPQTSVEILHTTAAKATDFFIFYSSFLCFFLHELPGNHSGSGQSNFVLIK